MMTANMKFKALKQLARTDGEKAQSALLKEAQKIAKTLQTETQYQLLVDQLTVLNEIAFRVSDEAIFMLQAFLKRLDSIELSYRDNPLVSVERFKEHYSRGSLTVKVLEVVERIRYHEPEAALKTFFEYSLSSIPEVKKQAEHGLSAIARYDLDVFWGDEQFKGVGAAPQIVIIEELQKLQKPEKERLVEAIVRLCNEMLSPTIEGTSWNYKTVTFKTGSVPAAEPLKAVRSASLALLMEVYPVAKSIPQKISILHALQQATRPPRNAAIGSKTLEMISANTVIILKFYEGLIAHEDLPIIQKIEHKTYWIHFHRSGEGIEKAALAVKKAIDSHSEYQIYKVLVGFEGVFEEWETKANKAPDEKKFKRLDEMRTRKALAYADSITLENLTEWRNRILTYSQIESNDAATFPTFVRFLKHFAEVSPKIALRLLNEDAEKLKYFVIALLEGGWRSQQRPLFQNLISDWLKERKYLFYIARAFEFVNDPDLEMLENVLAIASETEDRNVLAQVISVAVEHYGRFDHQYAVFRLFLPAIQRLTTLHEGGWIFRTWYMKQLNELLRSLDHPECQIILDNLLHLAEIDNHVEDVLYPIAEKYPHLVIDFFGRRIAKELGEEKEYDAVPFDFYELSKPLSHNPEKSLDIVKHWYKGQDYGSFLYRGARLLKITFPTFPAEFSDALIKLLRTGNENDLFVVMAVLRNYDGQQFLHPVCKELVKALPLDSDRLSEVEVILYSTGVVSGELGFAEAYRERKAALESWLGDENEKVRAFAKRSINDLDNSIAAEEKRAKEGIALRKFEWGDEDNGDQADTVIK